VAAIDIDGDGTPELILRRDGSKASSADIVLRFDPHRARWVNASASGVDATAKHEGKPEETSVHGSIVKAQGAPSRNAQLLPATAARNTEIKVETGPRVEPNFVATLEIDAEKPKSAPTVKAKTKAPKPSGITLMAKADRTGEMKATVKDDS